MQCGGKPKNSPTLTANNSGLKPSKLKTTTFSDDDHDDDDHDKKRRSSDEERRLPRRRSVGGGETRSFSFKSYPFPAFPCEFPANLMNFLQSLLASFTFYQFPFKSYYFLSNLINVLQIFLSSANLMVWVAGGGEAKGKGESMRRWEGEQDGDGLMARWDHQRFGRCGDCDKLLYFSSEEQRFSL